MKKRLPLFLAFLGLIGSAQAQLLWNKTYGTATTNQFLNRMIPLANGGYLLVGRQFAPNPNNYLTTLAIRTNSNGDTLWTRKYLPSGWDTAILYDAAEDGDGNLILVGGGTIISRSDDNGFILKVKPNGDTLWTRKIITPQTDRVHDIIIGNDGNYILNIREFNTPIIKKISKTGQTLWATPVSYLPSDPGLISGLTKTQNGYFVFSGSNPAQRGRVVKLTEAGVEQQSFFNFNPVVYDVITNPDLTMRACAGIMLYAYNTFGDTLWSKGYMMNTRPLWLTSIKPTPDGNYITLFERGNGNDQDVGLMKIAPNGTAIKDTLLFRYGYSEYGKDVAVDANGDYVFAGLAQVAGNVNHIYLAKHRKWSQTIGLKEDLDLAANIKLYPNPATDAITLESEKPLSGTISLYNLQGQLLQQETVGKMQQKVIPLQSLPAGIYILRFVSENGSQFSRKIVKQ